MKLFVLLISFSFLSPSFYSQTDSSQSASSSFLISDDSIIFENKEPVSMAGALSFSLILPGAGLFLSDNEGPAIAYLSVASVSYILGVVFLTVGEGTNDEAAFPFFLTGGLVHFTSIIHTLIATRDYNESIFPFVSYNGKCYQLGLSIKL
jgi:hypothetical protein